MSKMTPDLSWYPPQFPKQGRLPTSPALVGQNCKQQDSHELAYRNELCQAAGKLVEPPCCKTLHISLFFDGTGNNLNHDLYEVQRTTPPGTAHPTNIARLFRATIGQGYAGGVQGHQEELVDVTGKAGNKYYKYYIPGVGTPFPEIMDLDYTVCGLAAATNGEERINWALLRIIDALKRTLTDEGLSDGESWKAVQAMVTTWTEARVLGEYKRQEEFSSQLSQLAPLLNIALTQPEPGKPKLLGIKLYVYGFSRGAAAARAFVNWLNQLLPAPEQAGEKPELCLTTGALKVPLSVEFLGLLDTVASVGVAHIAPVGEGHMGWADGAMELPDNGLIKSCVHLVSSHEQRLCFPMDSICHHDGTYPSYAREVIYPGMHSDLGGGYPPGDQGKASDENDGYLLSQIALHDMYACAFEAGAPLKIPKASLPQSLRNDIWRNMTLELLKEFFVDITLVNRFNAWRELTLNLPSSEEIKDVDAAQYAPPRASVNIIKALEHQLGWLTAWRIKRYAEGTYKTQRFYIDSAANGQESDCDPAVRAKNEAVRDAAQLRIENARKQALAKARQKKEFPKLLPGEKDYDPALAQTQLREAAIEFRDDYQLMPRTQKGNWTHYVTDYLNNFIYTWSQDDAPAEYKKIKKAGEKLKNELFSLRHEAKHSEQTSDLVVALFDNQVHDSRAWFLYGMTGAREPWGSYFLYRMIYFGEVMSKNVTPIARYGRYLEGKVKDALPGSGFIIERLEKGGSLINEPETVQIKQKVSVIGSPTDISSVTPSEFASIPALNTDYASDIPAQQNAVEAEQLAAQKAAIASLWG